MPKVSAGASPGCSLTGVGGPLLAVLKILGSAEIVDKQKVSEQYSRGRRKEHGQARLQRIEPGPGRQPCQSASQELPVQVVEGYDRHLKRADPGNRLE